MGLWMAERIGKRTGNEHTYQQVINRVIHRMKIALRETAELKEKLSSGGKIYCSGLFLSARWFVLSDVAKEGFHLIVLPDREEAEYCSSDLYNLVEGDRVFHLPDSGRHVERSNYKSSLCVQRTAAIGKMEGAVLVLERGQSVKFSSIPETLAAEGFEKVDFVSAPGQYAVRGSIIDIFSYSLNHPFRLSFFGNEIENIHIFDCNTQLSVGETDKADIYPDLTQSSPEENGVFLLSILPADAVVWLDSSDMYREKEFYKGFEPFTNVFLDIPLAEREKTEGIRFHIAPQPVFNKNFELLQGDIRMKTETGYKVAIYGEKESQIERLKSILSTAEVPLPEFVKGKNIHSGFIDLSERICCSARRRKRPARASSST